jgi:hypothetical protein
MRKGPPHTVRMRLHAVYATAPCGIHHWRRRKSACGILVTVLLLPIQAGLDVDVLATGGSEPLQAVSSHPRVRRHEIPDM